LIFPWTMFKDLVKFKLKLAAKLILWRHQPVVIGITGSVGKTLTKVAVAKVLSLRYSVRASKGNYNNEFGLPLAIIGADAFGKNIFKWIKAGIKFLVSFVRSDYPEILVLEMAARKPGDIAYLCSIANPHIAFVTRVGSAHVDFFGDIEGMQKEKSQIIRSLPRNGVALLNADDPRVMAMSALHKGRIVTYGLAEQADIQASDVRLKQYADANLYDPAEALGLKFEVLFPAIGLGKVSQPKSGAPSWAQDSGRRNGLLQLEIDEPEKVSTPIFAPGLLGRPSVYSILAAFAVGRIFNISPRNIAGAFTDFSHPPGRIRPLAGIKNTIILDDTYNSSPEAAEEALRVLSRVKGKRRVAVLGDMLELGVATEDMHRKIGRLVQDLRIDLLFCVGARAAFIVDEARKRGFAKSRIKEFDTSDKARLPLQRAMREGDVVLVKGSQGMRMEKIVKEVMAEPERAEELLCRQDKSWKKNVAEAFRLPSSRKNVEV